MFSSKIAKDRKVDIFIKFANDFELQHSEYLQKISEMIDKESFENNYILIEFPSILFQYKQKFELYFEIENYWYEFIENSNGATNLRISW